jgi:hypothetical protein
VVYKLVGAIDVLLLSAGHKHADNAVCAKRLNAKSGNDRAVFSSGNADNRVAVLAVFKEKLSNPVYTLVFHL